jgi:hypothetical protein
MTETIQPGSNRFNLGRIAEVLFHPQRALLLIVEETQAIWLMPMLALSLFTFLRVFASGYLASQLAVMGDVQLPPDWQYWSPEMQNNYMQAQQAGQGLMFSYILPLFSALIILWLGWVVLSGSLFLGFTVLGAGGSMRGALNITGWSLLPLALRDILRILFMLFAKHAIVSPGLAGFAGDSAFLAQVLSHVDIFFIWTCILLVIGFGFSKNLTRKKAVIVVSGIILLLLFIWAGMGAFLSNLGASAV